LKTWAKNMKKPQQVRTEAQQNMDQHQLLMEGTGITKEYLRKETELHRSLHLACKREEEYWRQKSRSLWLQVGDRNTAFFHKQAEARKHFKNVSEIQVQGQSITEFDRVKEESHRHFKAIYSEDEISQGEEQ
jgi:phenylalanine-4-hydroxylase